MAAFFVVPTWWGTALQTLVTRPIELGLLQSWFSGMFSYGHNGGTWSLSCLAFQYLMFPSLLYLVHKSARRLHWVMLFCCYVLCAQIPAIPLALGISNVYSNQLLRLLQFGTGMLLAALLQEPSQKSHRAALWGAASFIGCTMIIIVTTWLKRIDLLRNQYVSYGFVTFPLFLMLIGSCVMAGTGLRKNLWGACSWKVLGDHAYAVFMTQIFVWEPVRAMKTDWPELFEAHGNYKTLFIASLLCVVLTILPQDCFNAPIQRTIWKRIALYQTNKRG